MPREDARAVSAMQVMSGVYPTGKGPWRKLPHAEQEAADLITKYSGVKVVAEEDPVAQFLTHPPDAQAFHFSGHGIYNPTSLYDGLVLSDLTYMDAELIGGGKLHPNPRPFVFLNACQAGTGSTTLGMYAGLAGAFMKAGAAAVVAPLWSVKDDEARQLSLQFYDLAVEQDVPPAEIVRRWRASFGKDQQEGDETPPSPIHLAYQYFGHPAMRLVRHRP
jgi:CHAT domain-containing protein